MILGAVIGTGHGPSRHAAYVGSWINAIRDDPPTISFKGLHPMPRRSVTFVSDLEQRRNQTVEIARSQTSAIRVRLFSGMLRS